MKTLRMAAVGVAVAALVPSMAMANERRFSFTYESAVLPPGAAEIEVWMTPRLMREQFYTRFDQRVEFEVGVTDQLMAAVYLNQTAITARQGDAYATQFEFGGLSTELKYKLLDPVANAVGLALYGEFTGSTNEAEVEGKLILDKKVGQFLLAANLVGEHEWEWEEPGDIHQETAVEVDLAGAFLLTDKFSFGLEIRNVNVFEDEGWAHSALFAGPVISYSEKGWWLTLTALPQLPALKGGNPEYGGLVLDGAEKFMGRLLFAVSL